MEKPYVNFACIAGNLVRVSRKNNGVEMTFWWQIVTTDYYQTVTGDIQSEKQYHSVAIRGEPEAIRASDLMKARLDSWITVQGRCVTWGKEKKRFLLCSPDFGYNLTIGENWEIDLSCRPDKVCSPAGLYEELILGSDRVVQSELFEAD